MNKPNMLGVRSIYITLLKKYCHTKREDGTVGIKLRPYQRDILDNFMGHRFNILMSSRQSGKTISASIFILLYLI
jgi:superfamily II DNA or RNA helicase